MKLSIAARGLSTMNVPLCLGHAMITLGSAPSCTILVARSARPCFLNDLSFPHPS